MRYVACSGASAAPAWRPRLKWDVRRKKMIALTMKSAKRFGVRYSTLTPVASGAWVVDRMKLHKGPFLLICTHQDSLYTIIRPEKEIGSLDELVEEIQRSVPQVSSNPSLPLHKNGNRSVTGSMNDMKNLIRRGLHLGNVPHMETIVDDCPFRAISYDKPKNRILA